MNSVIKITDNCIVDIMIVRAISWLPDNSDEPEGYGTIFVYFMRHEMPLETHGNKEQYWDFYTKWRNHTQWRLNLALGEHDNA